MIRVGVIGATGYAGAELVRIVAGHPDMELTAVTSRQYAGVRFDKIFPSMAGMVNIACEEFSAQKIAEKTDAVFTALPHKLPMAFVPELVKQGKKWLIFLRISDSPMSRNTKLFISPIRQKTC